MMRVLYTHRTQGVGAEGAHIKGMYEAFRELGHETSMHCLPGCNPSEREASAAAAAKGNGSAAPAPKPQGPGLAKRIYWLVAESAPQIVFEILELGYNIPLFAQLLFRCLKARPALVYERYSLNTFAPTLVCALLRIPHVLEVNDSVVIERSRPLRLKGVSSFLEGRCLASADLVITITGRFRDQLRARFGDKARIQVFTNAVDKARFDRSFDRDGARRRMGIGGGTVLGGTGQFLEWHGLKDLVEKLGPEAESRDLHFLFVGDGPARADVEAAAARLDIAPRVRFTGMLPIGSVPEALSALDMAVIPKAAAHASPMKLIEYMALGLPIVAPDLPSIREALVDESRGRIFPAGDMEAMRGQVISLLSDPAAAAALGRSARERVFRDLTWRRHAEEVLHILGLAADPHRQG